MFSWVFRNRRRLFLIYGSLDPTELPQDILSACGSDDELEPGRVVRRRRWTVIRPMPPRLGSRSDGWAAD